MKIGGFYKFSLVNCPGKFSAVLFTQGCNLRCSYCHNPELVYPEAFKESLSEERILDFLERRKSQLEALTITGGEPFMQTDLERFMEKVKEIGYYIKLDTNGCFPGRLENVIKKNLADYVAMDIKAPIDKYSQIAGIDVNTRSVQQSIDVIIQSGIDHEFRTTFTDPIANQEDMLKIIRILKGTRRYVLQKESNLPPDAKTHHIVSIRDNIREHVDECVGECLVR